MIVIEILSAIASIITIGAAILKLERYIKSKKKPPVPDKD